MKLPKSKDDPLDDDPTPDDDKISDGDKIFYKDSAESLDDHEMTVLASQHKGKEELMKVCFC